VLVVTESVVPVADEAVVPVANEADAKNALSEIATNFERFAILWTAHSKAHSIGLDASRQKSAIACDRIPRA
jgi:hypothetical protein